MAFKKLKPFELPLMIFIEEKHTKSSIFMLWKFHWLLIKQAQTRDSCADDFTNTRPLWQISAPWMWKFNAVLWTNKLTDKSNERTNSVQFDSDVSVQQTQMSNEG